MLAICYDSSFGGTKERPECDSKRRGRRREKQTKETTTITLHYFFFKLEEEAGETTGAAVEGREASICLNSMRGR
jgi:hypothetical protein